MGSMNRSYEPKFKRFFKDKNRKRKEYIPMRFRNKYERRRIK